MKPSFVEDLEYHVENIPGLKKQFSEIIKYNEGNEKKVFGLKGLNRLKSFEWQLKYAFCYYYIMQKCYGDFAFKNDESRLRFYATAYNYGFTKPFEMIESWMNEKAFPYGKKFNIEQFAFCDLSVAFFNHYSSQFEKTP